MGAGRDLSIEVRRYVARWLGGITEVCGYVGWKGSLRYVGMAGRDHWYIGWEDHWYIGWEGSLRYVGTLAGRDH